MPGQIELAREALARAPGGERVSYHPVDLLSPRAALPEGFDALWMSQFLDCFSEDQIRDILGMCRRAMGPESRLHILEPFWDRQQFRAASASVLFTSVYFTCMANGNSRMFHSADLAPLLADAGLAVEAEHDGLGIGHTLLVCRPVD